VKEFERLYGDGKEDTNHSPQNSKVRFSMDLNQTREYTPNILEHRSPVRPSLAQHAAAFA
jgi:hypothetical protein